MNDREGTSTTSGAFFPPVNCTGVGDSGERNIVSHLLDRLRECDYIISCGVALRQVENGRLKLPARNVGKKNSRLDTLERIQVSDRLELRRWLAANHLTSPGVWLVTYRRVTGMPRPRYEEIVDELVSFGWIDSTLVKLDETQTMQLCTPRNPRSHWSASNKERVERLMKQGLMQPRGLEAVTAAKANGYWDYLDGVDALEEPPDFAHQLDMTDGARQHWTVFPASYRKMVLYWIHSARRPQTRQSRIETAVAATASNTRLFGGGAGARSVSKGQRRE